MTKIVRLTAESFKRLVAVEIEPTGNVVTISGRNGEGKTSVLDAISAALLGERAFKLEKPIHEGADEAVVEVDLGDFVVRRRWRGERSQLEVTLASGAAVPKPRQVLDDLIGRLSFDPLSFAQAEAKEQRRMLLEVAGLTAADAEIQGKRQTAYDARTQHNRDAKRLKAQLDGLPRPAPELSTAEKVDISAVAVELSTASRELDEFLRLRTQVASVDAEMVSLRERLASLEQTREGMVARGRELAKKNLPPRVEELQLQLGNAQTINEAVERRLRREEVAEEAKASEAAARKATEMIEEADARRQELLASADLPIGGLGVDDDGVLLNGQPFSQASAAERLRTSVAMAMAMNPRLRVIRIADASLLDSSNLALISQMAEDKDFQVWLEVVDESKQMGFVIEDGQVTHRG